MKKGEKIKVPNSQFVKEMKDYNNNPYYSFFFNKNAKKKDSDEWYVSERYVINVMNIVVEPMAEIQITDILDAKPQIMYDKKGKEYLNCMLWVNADNIKVENQDISSSQPQSNSTTYQNEEYEDDLPF